MSPTEELDHDVERSTTALTIEWSTPLSKYHWMSSGLAQSFPYDALQIEPRMQVQGPIALIQDRGVARSSTQCVVWACPHALQWSCKVPGCNVRFKFGSNGKGERSVPWSIRKTKSREENILTTKSNNKFPNNFMATVRTCLDLTNKWIWSTGMVSSARRQRLPPSAPWMCVAARSVLEWAQADEPIACFQPSPGREGPTNLPISQKQNSELSITSWSARSNECSRSKVKDHTYVFVKNPNLPIRISTGRN